MSGTPGTRQPAYPPAFRADAVRLVEQSGKRRRPVAAERGRATESLRRWVQQARMDAGPGPDGALPTEEREALRRLRWENAPLRLERALLPQAAAFFAKETS
ncbi:MAG TPA: transposase [Dehalococcoidia bacterium]|nr:transposase [Dehalococcoidia bacterium]